MKKVCALILLVLLICASWAIAEKDNSWASAPVITKAYEQSLNKIYLEWTGTAKVYQIHLDGKSVADAIVNHCVIDVEKGMHNIVVYPIDEIRDADTNLGIEINALEKIGGSLSFDLATLGLDPKRLAAGTPSEKLLFDYKPSQIMNGAPESLAANADPENRIVLSFQDQYVADEYLLTIKHKNDTNYISFRLDNEEERVLVEKDNTKVKITLEPSLLQAQECFIPELNEEYKFTVQLRKYGRNFVNGEKENTIILESKVSSELTYRFNAAWKAAPVITFSSQTADGQITIEYDHEDYGAGCEYAILKINKVLGVKTGEEQLGVTTEKEFIVNDLTNGWYCINVVPQCNGEKGDYSQEANVEVKNEWVIAPELECEQTGEKQIRLTWNAPANVEKYHITVYKGDNNSLLRFVDMDFSKHAEFDIDTTGAEMIYLYTYDGDVDPENGLKMKFEIYGIHLATSGGEQKSSVSSKTLMIK